MNTKLPLKVKCIDNGDNAKYYLTIGEIYDVISINESDGEVFYRLKDQSEHDGWLSSRFEIVDESNGESLTKEDVVNKPSHYQLKGLGCEIKDVRKAILDGVEKKTTANAIDYWSRAWEYLSRMYAKHDNPLEDAKKARVYLDWLIEELEKSE